MIEKLLIGTFFVLLAALITSIITRKHKQQERFEAFKETFLPFIEILKTGNLPHGPESIGHLKDLFAIQETAMLKIKDRMKRKQLYRFATKWEEYILAVVTLEKQRIYKDAKLLNLITEILEIAEIN